MGEKLSQKRPNIDSSYFAFPPSLTKGISLFWMDLGENDTRGGVWNFWQRSLD